MYMYICFESKYLVIVFILITARTFLMLLNLYFHIRLDLSLLNGFASEEFLESDTVLSVCLSCCLGVCRPKERLFEPFSVLQTAACSLTVCQRCTSWKHIVLHTENVDSNILGSAATVCKILTLFVMSGLIWTLTGNGCKRLRDERDRKLVFISNTHSRDWKKVTLPTRRYKC